MTTGQPRIPLARPVITARERELVLEVLDSRQLSLGPMLARFERDWAERIGVRHAVACSSGTAGLHMCLHAAGIGPGDEVIVPSLTFVSSANNVALGATPKLCRSTDDTTVLIYALRDYFGSARQRGRRGQSEAARASA